MRISGGAHLPLFGMCATLRVPSKSPVSQTSRAMYASPAKRPLTRPDMRDTLSPRERDRYQNNSPLPGGESAQRRRAGEGSFSTPSDFDGALVRSWVGSAARPLAATKHDVGSCRA